MVLAKRLKTFSSCSLNFHLKINFSFSVLPTVSKLIDLVRVLCLWWQPAIIARAQDKKMNKAAGVSYIEHSRLLGSYKCK